MNIYPGKIWLDTDGNRIHAHGGSIFYHEGYYYWYGENKENVTGRTDGNDCNFWHFGVRMYRSANLSEWQEVGIIVPPDGDERLLFSPRRIMDRPHLLRHPNGYFVMWSKMCGIFKQEFMQSEYAVLVADEITGPYRLVRTVRPLGNDGGDFDLVLRENQTAFLVFDRSFKAISVCELTGDFLNVTADVRDIIQGGKPPYSKEAPAYFARNGREYLLTSMTTGYFPNPTECFAFTGGAWTSAGFPCVGDKNNNSFATQFSSVFKHPFKKDLYIALGDRWLVNTDPGFDASKVFAKLFEENLSAGERAAAYAEMHKKADDNTSLADYVWLPIVFEGDTPKIFWQDSWNIDDFE